MKLSPHQRRILEQICLGLMRPEVCRRLSIKPSSYDCALKSLKRRNGVASLVQLGMVAERAGVLSPRQRTVVEDQRFDRIDARRRNGGVTLDQFFNQQSES